MKQIFTTLFLLTAGLTSQAQLINHSLPAMVATSDNIFIGTAAQSQTFKNNKGFPLTNVSFTGVESAKTLNNNFDIQYAGGTIDDKIISMTHTPELVPGQRYVVFASDKEKGYYTPINGFSGLLQLMKDAVSNEEYLMMEGHFVKGFKDGKFALSGKRVSEINNGVPVFVDVVNPFEHPMTATDADGHVSTTSEAINEIEIPLTLAAFKHIIAAQFNLNFTQVDVPANATPTAPNPNSGEKTTAALYVCGYQILPIEMVQVPSSIKFSSVNTECMANWNAYMNIFKALPATGTYGSNYVNEFGGFPSTADLQNAYGNGFSWATGAVAVTFSKKQGSCGEILEADIFANPAFSFTDNAWEQVVGPSLLYRIAIMHELGHAWGFQSGQGETYDYPVPTYMQSLSNGIYENGLGLHTADAYFVRGQYTNQTTVPSKIDLGIESYYAIDGTGLRPATISVPTVKAGATFDVKNVTIENISTIAVSNVSVQFYLSTDSVITATDLLVGSKYLFTNTFTPESYSVNNFTLAVATTTPGGRYYVGALIMYDTTKFDAVTGNNFTILSDKITVIPTANSINTVTGDAGNIRLAKMEDKGHYTLQLQKAEAGTIRIYNAVGQLVITQSLDEINIFLPAADGIYMMEVKTTNERKTFKLLNY